MKRRTFIHGVSSAAFLGIPQRGWSLTELPVGPDLTLTTLCDGHLSLPESFLYGDLDPEAVRQVIEAADVSAGGLEPPCNVTLLRRDDTVVLFDAGSGANFMPSAGKLPEALAAVDLTPDDITHVVFTHAHPDHLWGVLDDFDEPFFRNARHLMGGVEHRYWSDPQTVDTIAAERQSFAAGASRRLEILGDAMEIFEDGDEVLPGVTANMTPGHTPGHMSFEIDGGDARAFLIGDAIGNDHIALRKPDWHAPADQDPETGAATRRALLERLADAQMPAIGFHLPGGGAGRIVRDGDVFGWVSD